MTPPMALLRVRPRELPETQSVSFNWTIAMLAPLIALGIAVERGFFNDAAWMAQDTPHRVAYTPEKVDAHFEAVTPSSNPSLSPSDNANLAQSVEGMSAARRRLDEEPIGAMVPRQQNQGSSDFYRIPASRNVEVLVDDSVIGRPFPVSESVAAACRAGPCLAVVQLLSKFAHEPRDLQWASDIEARLGELVMAEHGEFTIRAIECRQSLCVAEVASIHGSFSFNTRIRPNGTDANHELSWKDLWVGIGDFGYEMDPSGARITVTLQVFSRYPVSMY